REPVLGPVRIQVGRLVGKAFERVGELAGRLTRLGGTQHDPFDVYAAGFVRIGGRSHVDRTSGASTGGDASEMFVVLVDPQRQRVFAVDVGFDDRVPAFFEVFLHFGHEAGRVHGQVAGHDQQ